MIIGTAEIIVMVVSGIVFYSLLSLSAASLPIKNDYLRGVAMALWPVTMLVACLLLPVIIWRVAKDGE